MIQYQTELMMLAEDYKLLLLLDTFIFTQTLLFTTQWIRPSRRPCSFQFLMTLGIGYWTRNLSVCATYTGMKTRPLAISFLSIHHIFTCFCAARAFVLLHSHFPSPLHRTALSNVAYAVPAGYIYFLNDLFGDEAEPTGLAWHSCIESF